MDHVNFKYFNNFLYVFQNFNRILMSFLSKVFYKLVDIKERIQKNSFDLKFKEIGLFIVSSIEFLGLYKHKSKIFDLMRSQQL